MQVRLLTCLHKQGRRHLPGEVLGLPDGFAVRLIANGNAEAVGEPRPAESPPAPEALPPVLRDTEPAPPEPEEAPSFQPAEPDLQVRSSKRRKRNRS